MLPLLTGAGPTVGAANPIAAQFAKDGYVGPFMLGSSGQMQFVSHTLLQTVFNRPGPAPDDPFVNRHLDSPVVEQLCTHPAIFSKIEQLLGHDLVVWRSLFFSKGPGSKDIAWHQDGHFWKLDPSVTITAWLAIDRAHISDHCMQIIPGSHMMALPHTDSGPTSQFPKSAEIGQAALARAIDLPVEAGMFVLFDQRLLHRSRPGGKNRRLALSIRIAPANVRIDPALLPASGRVLSMRSTSAAGDP